MRTSIYAPPYYERFECIKGECRHTCCAGWRIDVDEDTLALYDSLEGELAEEIRKRLSTDADGTYIPLTECGRCPHLDEHGLCRIISALGEGATSEICREHPRFYNPAGDRLEVGLGFSCEAAARLILSSGDYLPTVYVGECEGVSDNAPLLAERDRMLAILSDKTSDYRDKLARLASEYGIPEDLLMDEKWREIFRELEYKNELSAKRILARGNVDAEVREDYLERFLAYMIYRHVTPAACITDMRARLGFCLLSARVLKSMAASAAAYTLEEYAELARIYSEEIEYSEDNTDTLIFEIECEII